MRLAVEQEMAGVRRVQGRRLFVHHHGTYAQRESQTLGSWLTARRNESDTLLSLLASGT